MSNGKSHPTPLEGFKSIFEALYPSLCLFANKYINDMDTSKDLVQEVFIKVWEKQPPVKNYNALKGYLYTAVKNQCLNYLKSNYFKTMGHATPINLAQLQTEDYFLAEMATVETYAQLYKAIETLPDKTGKVIQLSLNNYTTKEIAEELSVTPSTVRTQKSMAYQKLRGLLHHINHFFNIL